VGCFARNENQNDFDVYKFLYFHLLGESNTLLRNFRIGLDSDSTSKYQRKETRCYFIVLANAQRNRKNYDTKIWHTCTGLFEMIVGV
jgi:hypothetical protein